jgi:hypothetical protein
VHAQHGLDVGGRGRPVDLPEPPLFGVVPHGLPAGVRVDELPGDERRDHLVQPALGVDFPCERSTVTR